MKLLNSFVSPFAARVRLAIYAYDLPVEIVPSGQWLENYEKAPAYLAINPIGLVPTLVLDNRTALPESSVIVEYLADRFPETGLRPGTADSNGNARLLAHLAELYVQMPARPLIGQIVSGQHDDARIAACIAAMDKGLSYLDYFLGNDRVAAGHAITMADCALVPYLYFFADCMPMAFGLSPVIDKHSNVDTYWRCIQGVSAAQKIMEEMRGAIAKSPLRRLVAASSQTTR